jgi:hypothetical protein
MEEDNRELVECEAAIAAGGSVMSDTLQQDEADNSITLEPTMFPPAPLQEPAPLAGQAEELPEGTREAALDAVERALAASVRLHRMLPPAPMIEDAPGARPRRPAPPAEADPAIRRLRARLRPVAMVVPPIEERRSTGAMAAWIVGAVALASLVALLAVGVLPLPFGSQAESHAGPWARAFPAEGRAPAPPVVAEAPERVAAAAPVQPLLAAATPAEPEPVPQTAKAEPVPPPAEPPAAARTLDRDELTILYDRSVALVEQGDIASARLMLTRAAEAGDARSALALGATYDPAALEKLGVLGVAPDPAQAHAWYAKAVELGSAEAVVRLETLATR